MTDEVPFSVTGKRALITGGGSGINFELTRLLLERNCSVLIADLALRPEASQLVEKYAQGSPRAVFQKTDVTDWKQLLVAFDACKREFGGVDIVGPGAGVFEEHWSHFAYPPGSKESRDTLEKSTYRCLDINLTHPIRAAQMALSEFLNPRDPKDKVSPSNPKRIIMTSSIAGQAASIVAPLYFVSKHGVSAFTRSLGSLESIGVRCNAVAPGVVKTPLWLEHPEKLQGVDEEKDQWVLPVEVAEQMIRLMEDLELKGGTILEVSAVGTRVVPALMNPGPENAAGTTMSDGMKVAQDVMGQIMTPGWGQMS